MATNKSTLVILTVVLTLCLITQSAHGFFREGRNLEARRDNNRLGLREARYYGAQGGLHREPEKEEEDALLKRFRGPPFDSSGSSVTRYMLKISNSKLVPVLAMIKTSHFHVAKTLIYAIVGIPGK
ncbi:predicted protein [Nematostella vectensis]|uniref:Uncharacterized protein n=1 Tax=Nematostella vectensis TaxID=45351 RepID=A7RX36_NEMVE|nr:predicted protein [Nematostella vectensis]|eukprot:XP_001636022.1 predicted protein [Nematostella vectensis]